MSLPVRAALVCSTTFRPYHDDWRSHPQRLGGSHPGSQARPPPPTRDPCDTLSRARGLSSAWLQPRHHQPPLRPPLVDQLLGGQARPCAQVGEVALRRARPDAHELGGVLARPARRLVVTFDADVSRRSPSSRPRHPDALAPRGRPAERSHRLGITTLGDARYSDQSWCQAGPGATVGRDPSPCCPR